MDNNGNFYILVADDDVGKKKFDVPFNLMMENHFRIRHPEWIFLCVNTKEEAIKILLDADELRNKLKIQYPDLKLETKVSLDLILLDIEFPDKQKGLEVAEVIKKGKLNLPIIFFTHYEDPETIIGTLTKDYSNKDYCIKSSIFDFAKYEDLEKKMLKLFEKTGRFKNEYGILITHGTDTMAWGFAILRYALKKIKYNIVITGSQIPLQDIFSPSDAISNIKTSLFILNKLKPPAITCVFDNGKTIFAKHLQKVKKWDFNAFIGEVIGLREFEHVLLMNESFKLSIFSNNKLNRLHLITTGGTIESSKEESGYKPTKRARNYLIQYIGGFRDTYFKDISTYHTVSKDSSCLSPLDWENVAIKVKEIQGDSCKVDNRFNWGVKVIAANPFFTTDDYMSLFRAQAIILLGYGAGNANIDENSSGTIIPALKWAREKRKIVVISSQVPLETYDFDYEAGRRLLEIGAVPSGSLSYPDAQVKLAYILGHQKEIKEIAKKYGLTEYQLTKGAFLAGVEFRKEESKKEYEKITQKYGPQIKILHYNPFSNPDKDFEDALTEVAKFQKE